MSYLKASICSWRWAWGRGGWATLPSSQKSTEIWELLVLDHLWATWRATFVLADWREAEPSVWFHLPARAALAPPPALADVRAPYFHIGVTHFTKMLREQSKLKFFFVFWKSIYTWVLSCFLDVNCTFPSLVIFSAGCSWLVRGLRPVPGRPADCSAVGTEDPVPRCSPR